jgi:pantothenate kinase type III
VGPDETERGVLTVVCIGNSRTACAEVDQGGGLSRIARVAHGEGDPLRGFALAGRVHVASVVEDRARALVADLRRRGAGVTWWGTEREIPVAHSYAPPEKPGADRLLAARAAHARAGGACVAVDAGTAVTVNAVDAGGALLGGVIGPGWRALGGALLAAAPALPPPAAYEGPFPPRSAAQAVGYGVLAAFAGMIQAATADSLALLGPVPVFVTGGDGLRARVALHRHAPIVVPDLVLEGLALVAREA